uniref:Dynein heavy chain n=1 Tax=Steinernema glaseri TaxID=37863 RepID=A0A1I7YXT5_9BILA
MSRKEVSSTSMTWKQSFSPSCHPGWQGSEQFVSPESGRSVVAFVSGDSEPQMPGKEHRSGVSERVSEVEDVEVEVGVEELVTETVELSREGEISPDVVSSRGDVFVDTVVVGEGDVSVGVIVEEVVSVDGELEEIDASSPGVVEVTEKETWTDVVEGLVSVGSGEETSEEVDLDSLIVVLSLVVGLETVEVVSHVVKIVVSSEAFEDSEGHGEVGGRELDGDSDVEGPTETMRTSGQSSTKVVVERIGSEVVEGSREVVVTLGVVEVEGSVPGDGFVVVVLVGSSSITMWITGQALVMHNTVGRGKVVVWTLVVVLSVEVVVGSVVVVIVEVVSHVAAIVVSSETFEDSEGHGEVGGSELDGDSDVDGPTETMRTSGQNSTTVVVEWIGSEVVEDSREAVATLGVVEVEGSVPRVGFIVVMVVSSSSILMWITGQALVMQNTVGRGKVVV